MKNTYSKALIRQRKFLMALPAIALPFVTLAFWSMGGGRQGVDRRVLPSDGLNTKLPEARQDKDFTNKLSFYDKAVRDSIKIAESIKNDPYYKQDLQTVTRESLANYPDALNNSPGRIRSPETSEKKLMDKLAILQQQLQEPPSGNGSHFKEFQQDITDPKKVTEKSDLSSTKIQNPQLKQMESMLDKILEIQHPERVKDKQALKPTDSSLISSISNTPIAKNDTGFFSLTTTTSESPRNAIKAVVHQTQTLINGSIVKLRLQNDLFIDTVKIAKGSFIFGNVTFNNERLEIVIESIRSDYSIFPVSLEVFDLDGMAGIYIPGAISRDVAKQSADNSLQLLELSAMDPSFKAQATAAGIQTAKNLLSKKVKLVKVVVKAGYKVLLKNTQ